MATPPQPVAGAVLCGGASRRMGTDKALIRVDGVPLAERVARTLEAAGCRPVVFVGGDAPALSAATGRPVVTDGWPGDGPVGGVLTALAAFAGAPAVLVAACDLPSLTVAAVSAVVDGHRRASSSGVAVGVTIADSGRPEPALACWSTKAIESIADAFSVDRGWLAVARSVGAGTVRVDAAALRNANQPHDLPEAETPTRHGDGATS